MPPETQRPHIFLHNHGEDKPFTTPRRGDSPPPPERLREEHSLQLLRSMGASLAHAERQMAEQDPKFVREVEGFYLEFKLKSPNYDTLGKLENRKVRPPIELMSVRKDPENEDMAYATVFVPGTKKDFFVNRIQEYRTKETKYGNPQHNSLIAHIEEILIAGCMSIFTGDVTKFPIDGAAVWWEVWLRKGSYDHFVSNLNVLNLRHKSHPLDFIERKVVLVHTNTATLGLLLSNTDSIAELRLACDNPSFFMRMPGDEQRAWGEAVRYDAPAEGAPAVCILDSGSSPGHPLLSPALSVGDTHACDPTWQSTDTSPNGHGGHGTEMSGLALYGDLAHVLAEPNAIILGHRLESVKILPDDHANEPNLYGEITRRAISIPEIAQPRRPRVFCLAVTEDSGDFTEKPTSWSSAIDNDAYNSDHQRLICISAGNVYDDITSVSYLDINDTSPIESPGQAWNALTVGAYTDKCSITDETYAGWQPVASVGKLSPRSRTSTSFSNGWPIKPDVVFEGGNLAIDPATNVADDVDDLLLLTTFRNHRDRLFTVSGDTSAGTALAARMAAQLMSQLLGQGKPLPWPETVRALIVHSACWTPAMLAELPAERVRRQGDWRNLLCRYGYGVPNLDRAVFSSNKSVNLVIEKRFRPYVSGSSNVKTKDMVLHELPWPKDDLLELGDAEVEMRVTLSYYIEPNPGERGWTKRHRYASHGLRFAVKREDENVSNFLRRINRAARTEDDEIDTGGDDNWLLGPRLRDRGSIHSDVWRGTAANLATKHALAVCPVGGWWKEKKNLGRYTRSIRYSLVVSLKVLADVTADIYTPIENMVSIPVTVA